MYEDLLQYVRVRHHRWLATRLHIVTWPVPVPTCSVLLHVGAAASELACVYTPALKYTALPGSQKVEKSVEAV